MTAPAADEPTPIHYTRRQTADLLGVSVSHVDRLCRLGREAGGLEARNFATSPAPGRAALIRITKRSVDAFLADREVVGGPEAARRKPPAKTARKPGLLWGGPPPRR